MTHYTYDDRIVSDLYKDVYGTRSMASGWSRLSADEKQTEWDRLIARLEDELAEDEIRKSEAIARFEARVTATMDLVHGASREDAIRIIADAEGVTPEDLNFYGWESLEHALGLPYGYIKEQLQRAA